MPKTELPIQTIQIDMPVTIETIQSYAKGWINDNLHDGEDRSKAKCDKHYMTAPDLYDLVYEMLDDIFNNINDEKIKK